MWDFDILGTTLRKKREPTFVTEAHREEVRATGWDRRYWDDRSYPGQKGYVYDGRWKEPARRLIEHYELTEESNFLDVGCGKGFLPFEMMALLPGISVGGLDVSEYALSRALPEVRPYLIHGDARELPFPDLSFDLVVSLATVYMLDLEGCAQAIQEIERVGKRKLIQVVTYRTEGERTNMERYDMGMVRMSLPRWKEFLQELGYTGDVSWYILI